MKKLKGLITAPFTAFTASNELNLEMIQKQQAVYKRNGISGVFICGTTGESSALTMEEKKTLFKEWSQYKTPDFAILGFLGGTCVKECQELALYAEECGLDAISVTAPYYFRPANCQALADFCKEVAAATPNMPFYYYHIPSFTGVNFPMIDLLELMDASIPNLAGIKYTYENMMDFQSCLNFKDQKYNILWGRDEMLLPALAIGATGAVGSTYGYMAPIYTAVIKAYEEGDIETARTMQMKSIEFIGLLNKFGGGTGKAFMKAIGLDLGLHRSPVINLSAEQWASFSQYLKEMQFAHFCCK